MDTPIYNQSGNITAFIGLALLILSKFGVQTDANTVMAIIGGISALIGIIKQYIAHRKLALVAGAISR